MEIKTSDFNIKILLLLFLISSICFCTQTQGKVERMDEDGVEVIVNREEPYLLDKRSEILSLEEELSIDLEDENIAAFGLTRVWGFDADSEGNIYLFKPPMSQGDLVYKFDPKGQFLLSFAPQGQGPGEIQMPAFHKINGKDEILIRDVGSSKIFVFEKNGKLIDEIKLDLFFGSMGNMMHFLENGNYLIRRSLSSPAGDRLELVLSVFNPEFEEITELDRMELIQPMMADKISLPIQLGVWSVSQRNIYVANEKGGYEIRVYDLEGNLKKKIRKKCDPVPLKREFKQEVMDKLQEAPQVLRDKVIFPDYFPPFRLIFNDDSGRLYVMTYAEGKTSGENLFDIFDPEGIYTGAMSMNVALDDPVFTPGAPFDTWITMKKDRLYSLREKSSGYREFVVYKAIWNDE